MSLPNHLARIKSSGIYRYTFDKSIIPQETIRTLRLVVGYSERGPFNTPVYIETAQEFISTFGNPSRRLERKGIFFHRLALQALTSGPILCFNAKPFNLGEKIEESSIIGFNAADIYKKSSIVVTKSPIALDARGKRGDVLSSIYDTNRFWFTDPSGVHKINMGGNPNKYDYVRIVQTGSREDSSTLFIRPAQSQNMHVRISDWYAGSNEDMPEYMDAIADHYLDEYMVDVYAFKGKFSKEQFSHEGGTLGQHVQLQFVYAKDEDGNLLYWPDSEKPILHKVMAYSRDGERNYKEYVVTPILTGKLLNDELLANIDPSSDAYRVVREYYKYILVDREVDMTGYEFDASIVSNKKIPNDLFEQHKNDLPTMLSYTNEAVYGADSNGNVNYSNVVPVHDSSNWISKLLNSYYKQNLAFSEDGGVAYQLLDYIMPIQPSTEHETLISWCAMGSVDEFGDVTINEDFYDSYGNKNDALEAMTNVSTSNHLGTYTGILFPGFRDGNGRIISIDEVFNADFQTHHMHLSLKEDMLDRAFELDLNEDGDYEIPEKIVKGPAPTHWGNMQSGGNPIPIEFRFTTRLDGQPVDPQTMPKLKTDTFNAYKYLIDGTTNLNFDKIYEDVVAGGILTKKAIKEYDKPVAYIYNSGYQTPDKYDVFTFPRGEVSWVSYNKVPAKPDQDENPLHTKVKDPANPSKANASNHYSTVAGYIHALVSPHVQVENSDVVGTGTKGIYMEGYTYNSIKKNDSGRELQDKIFSVFGYKGIFEALTNNVDSDWHYLIDTFQTYPGLGMKSILSNIASKKDNALAILNFPTMASIMEHCGVSRYDGGFDMNAITKPINGISLPTESQGASWCAFYTQVTSTELGLKTTIPSAALVSNLYMVKHGPGLPYNIVAGPNYGAINHNGIVGPDYSYARKDLDVLEPFGVNAIVHLPRYGTVINSNQTAKQTPVSALSKVHVRELVTFLQNEIEAMLRAYQWELNTAALRAKVKTKADTILELCKNNGGVYVYTTRCDDTNNTPEVIDNEILVLDVEIEAARGTGKMVQTLTLHRTGGLHIPSN